MDRFARVERLIGRDKARWLRKRSVTIVGIGAVGGYALEGLVRTGVGNIRLVDFDAISVSNINRQLHALESTIGELKVEAAAQRVADINPQCRVETLPLFVDPATVPDILSPAPDLLIDAIDSISSKIELLVTAYRQEIAVVSSMGAALRTNPSLVAVADLFETSKCPLAKRMRNKLRKIGVGSGITCVYSTETIIVPPPDAYNDDDDHDETNPAGRGRSRQMLGSLPTLTGIFGLTVANAAIDILLRQYSLEQEE